MFDNVSGQVDGYVFGTGNKDNRGLTVSNSIKMHRLFLNGECMKGFYRHMQEYCKIRDDRLAELFGDITEEDVKSGVVRAEYDCDRINIYSLGEHVGSISVEIRMKGAKG